MPNYHGPLGHRNTTIALGIAASLVPLLTRDPRDFALAGGCWLGLAITPDWDIDRRKVGFLGKLQFVDEYAKLVPHRGKTSHTPVLGTLIRFLLTFTIPLSIFGLITGLWPGPWLILQVFAGLCLADTLHVILDTVSTALKRRARRVKRRR
jgi:uncharacterized metal-binding protein